MLEPQSWRGCRTTDGGPVPRRGPSSRLKQQGRRRRQMPNVSSTEQTRLYSLSRLPQDRLSRLYRLSRHVLDRPRPT